MAVYKVPQDVEADDKLIGPFSPRQALYAGIVAITLGLIFVLGQQLGVAIAMMALAALLPVILIFGALALPLRKEQPMETYLAALVRFYMKPRDRLWQADGSVALVEITAPKVVEEVRSKSLNEDQARSQLDYLAQLMDSRGWAAKGIVQGGPSMVPSGVVIPDSDTSSDMLDDHDPLAQSFDQLMNRQYAEQKKAAMAKMQQSNLVAAADTELPATTDISPTFGQQRVIEPANSQVQEPASAPEPDLILSSLQLPSEAAPAVPTVATPTQAAPSTPLVQPQAMPTQQTTPVTLPSQPAQAPQPQSMASTPAQEPPPAPPQPATPAPDPQPIATKPAPKAKEGFHLQPPAPEVTTSTKGVSSGTINLAYNNDLSISAIANEAHRLEQQKQSGEDEEVVISLRQDNKAI